MASYERMTYTEMIRDDRLRNSDSSRFSSTVATPTAQLVTDTIDAAIMTEAIFQGSQPNFGESRVHSRTKFSALPKKVKNLLYRR